MRFLILTPLDKTSRISAKNVQWSPGDFFERCTIANKLLILLFEQRVIVQQSFNNICASRSLLW